MRPTFCLAALAAALTGCAAPARQRSAADEISWAGEQIDGQRVIKRRLLLADPLERRVEAHLNADPRVECARFAILIPGFGVDGVSDAAPFFFRTVVTTREPMTDAETLQLLREAFDAAQAAGGAWGAQVVRDDNTWSASGTIHPTAAENPDLSGLPRE